MADVALPAPGGSVGIQRFVAYAAGGLMGLFVYRTIAPRLPEWAFREFAFGLDFDDFLMVSSALVGAGLFSRMIK